MTDPTVVTAEMVLQAADISRGKATRIAAFITARYAGQRPIDAAREVGIGAPSVLRYERYIPLLQQIFDLPEVPPHGPQQYPYRADPSASGVLGAHVRHHVQRGVTSPTCPHCQEGGDRHG